jgi:hypothetical protein
MANGQSARPETMSSTGVSWQNLVEPLEVEARERGLQDCEIFLFTDNTQRQRPHWKGTLNRKAI